MSSPGPTPPAPAKKSDVPFYLLGSLFGIAAGWIDVKVGDLLLTAVFVMFCTMLLGVVRPERPWRWVLAVAIFVPLSHLFAYYCFTQKPYRAQIYESFLGFLTGTVGAYAGYAGRQAIRAISGKS
ncbi:MAG: hypothetical protein JST79_14425 [Acidobacteria bacterium]|nr:hypothetical protein [Acidobacteriota bacterium]